MEQNKGASLVRRPKECGDFACKAVKPDAQMIARTDAALCYKGLIGGPAAVDSYRLTVDI